ncbi:MAG: rod shape-determining protein [Pseudomonadota bacterium]
MARFFSDDIAIDLGTANTLVYVVDRGIILDEPSAVALRSVGGRRDVIAVGSRARNLEGRAPENTEVLRPMRDGVIADFLATEEMLRQFIQRAKSSTGFRRPRILICVPAGATPVERRAVYETALSAGSRRVLLIEEPVAAAIGSGISVDGPMGCMVVDIGGGTTDVAVLSNAGVIQARALRCAGNAMDQAIVQYVRRQHKLLIGERNAERIKIEAGTVAPDGADRGVEIHIRGRDVREGRAKSVILTSADVARALADPVDDIIDFVQRALEDMPAEVASDIFQNGLQLTGGGAHLEGLGHLMAQRLGVSVTLPDNPLHSVILGSARVLQELDDWERLLITP